jgi:RNA polymerase sigma-70 factor (ECF subfamily)
MDREAYIEQDARRTAFLGALDETRRLEVDGIEPAELDAKLDALWQAARSPFPRLAVDGRLFLRGLIRRTNGAASFFAAAEQLYLGDLYLACGCAAGHEAALRVFEDLYLPEIDAVLRRRGHEADRIDEVKQQIRQKLFVPGPDGQAGKIEEYSGRGELKAWLRTVAVRTALNHARRERRPTGGPGDDPLLELIDGSGPSALSGPEVDFLKAQYRHEFRLAFKEALASLEPRERLILRQHTLDGLSADEIGALYGVHRVSAFRWLSQTRGRLKQATCRMLRDSLKVSAPELESILRLIESQLDVSLTSSTLRSASRHPPSPGN